MKSRDFDPRRLDIKAFAKAAGTLAGSWPLSGFERLSDMLASGEGGMPAEAVDWSVQGEERAVRGGSSEVWLLVRAEATLPLVCQRCLLAYPQRLSVQNSIQFVADEALAAEIDAEAEHDVLVFSKDFDLHELVEDELLLGLPLVPRHEVCPEPLTNRSEDEPEAPREHPFAALAGLKTGGR